jgi:uncharacterized protein YndB with AHSA1/START domain
MVAKSGSGGTVTTSGRELRIERTFDAPRDLVWKAWTEADRLKQWWGPRSYPTTYCTVDLRVGGVWHYCMTGPEGQESWGKATYQEIVPPERLVFLDQFSDKDGNAAPGMPETTIKMEFVERDGKTVVTATAEYASIEDLEKLVGMGMIEGMTETWDRLEEYLAAQS